MKLQIADGSWINARHVSVYYISSDKDKIGCKMIDGGHHYVLNPDDPRLVNQEFLDDVVRIVCAKKLNHTMLSQYEIWKELDKL